MPGTSRFCLIVNPRAGARARRSSILDRVRGALEARGTSHEIRVSDRPGHATELAREAVVRRVPVVVAVGGDGTLNEVARGLLGTDAALGMIPVGSGNGFARDLGISLEPERAVAQLERATARVLDIGDVEGHLFLMTAGFGLDAHIIHRVRGREARTRGIAAYLRVGLRELYRYRPPRLRFDPERGPQEALLLVAANTRQFGGGAVIAPRARPDDGLLDWVFVPPLGPLRTLYYGLKLFSGTIDTGSRVRIERSAEVVVEGTPGVPLCAQVDGEPLELEGPVRVRCRPAAIKVWAPA